MRYPRLVPDRVCRTPCIVRITTEGIDKDGAPITAFKAENIRCNYQDRARTYLDKEKKMVRITGKALFNGDLCPGLAVISGGTFTVNGVSRRILEGTKARDPDGTVNYTELILE